MADDRRQRVEHLLLDLPHQEAIRPENGAVSSVAAAFLALSFVIAVVGVVSGNVQKGESRGAAVTAAVVLLVLTAALAWFARLVEHHVRTWHGHVTPIAPGGTPLPPSPPAPRSSPRVGRHAPHSRVGGMVWIGVLAAIFVAVSISGFVDWQKSETVQQHGIKAAAVVTSVDFVQHDTRSGSYDTVNLDVGLVTPVLGRDTTTVYTPDSTPPAPVGAPIAILVDRSDPGYAELPGQPANGIAQGVAGAGGFVLFVGLALFIARAYRPARVGDRRRR